VTTSVLIDTPVSRARSNLELLHITGRLQKTTAIGELPMSGPVLVTSMCRGMHDFRDCPVGATRALRSAPSESVNFSQAIQSRQCSLTIGLICGRYRLLSSARQLQIRAIRSYLTS
jgi:hypothetical protein